ncbi:MAG: Uma2 family endonuclease [Solimonas sp.]
MSRPVPKPARYEDLFDLPDHMIGQIVHGVLHAQPRPAPPHARATTRLIGHIEPPFRGGRGGPGGWEILVGPELHLGPHILVPDLAGWRRERLPELPETAYFDLPPDWICEVLSPSTARLDRIEKMPIYAQFVVQWLWLLDPQARTLEVFSLDRGRWTLEGSHADDARVKAPPFDAVELELDPLWIKPSP